MDTTNKNYQWATDAQFTLTGNEFGLLYNIMKEVTGTNQFMDKLIEARSTSSLASLMDLMNNKLKENITSGVVKEMTEEDFKKAQEAANTPAKAIMDSQVVGN